MSVRCLDCGTNYIDVDALVAANHWTGVSCPERKEEEPRRRSNNCVDGKHPRCRGSIPGRLAQCECACHLAVTIRKATDHEPANHHQAP